MIAKLTRVFHHRFLFSICKSSALSLAFFLSTGNIGLAANTANIFIIDSDGPENASTLGALYSVDPATGQRAIVSDFSDETQGPLGLDPRAISVEPAGTILVLDQNAGNVGAPGKLFRVDPDTGSREVVTDFGDSSQGPLGQLTPVGVAVSPSGSIFVIDAGQSDARGLLFKINSETGIRTIISDFANDAQGQLGLEPSALAIEVAGSILVTDTLTDLLYRVDPVTGNRTVVSDFTDTEQGPKGDKPLGIATAPSGEILVADFGLRALFSVNPVTGSRTILSNLNDESEGPLGQDPGYVAYAQSGAVFLTDYNYGEVGCGPFPDPDCWTEPLRGEGPRWQIKRKM